MEALAATGMIGAVLLLLVIWWLQSQGRAPMPWLYRTRTWTRAMLWTVPVGIVVTAALAAAGTGAGVYLTVAALLLEGGLWSLARTFGTDS